MASARATPAGVAGTVELLLAWRGEVQPRLPACKDACGQTAGFREGDLTVRAGASACLGACGALL